MRITEESLEFDYWTLQILLTRSRSEIALHNMQSTRSRIANGKRLRNYQNPIDEKMDSEVVENRIINQTFISFYYYKMVLKILLATLFAIWELVLGFLLFYSLSRFLDKKERELTPIGCFLFLLILGMSLLGIFISFLFYIFN